jgi:hypothetical protein
LVSTTATGGSARIEVGVDDVEVCAEFIERQIGFVLPGQRHIAQFLLGERHGRPARAVSSTGTWL